MTGKFFAVLNARGPLWDHAKPMEQHEGWRAHADFMNALVAEGFVVLGGPLDGPQDILLIVRAENEAEVTTRLAPDVWAERLPATPLDRALDPAPGIARPLTLGGRTTTLTGPQQGGRHRQCSRKSAISSRACLAV